MKEDVIGLMWNVDEAITPLKNIADYCSFCTLALKKSWRQVASLSLSVGHDLHVEGEVCPNRYVFN